MPHVFLTKLAHIRQQVDGIGIKSMERICGKILVSVNNEEVRLAAGKKELMGDFDSSFMNKKRLIKPKLCTNIQQVSLNPNELPILFLIKSTYSVIKKNIKCLCSTKPMIPFFPINQ